MLSKPSDPGSLGRRFRPLTFVSSVRGRIVLGFGVLVISFLFVAVAAFALLRQHRADVREMEAHAQSVSLLDGIAVDSTGALHLLQTYVGTGDESLPPQVGLRLSSAAAGLNDAIDNEEALGNQDRAAALRSIVESSSGAPAAIQNIIEARRAGDVETASAQMAELNELQALSGVFEEAADGAQDDLAAVRSRSEKMSDVAIWLLVVAGGVGGFLALTASVLIARSIIKPLSRLEATALAVAGGDFDARAPTQAPQELASLGRSLNRMTDSLLDASRRRELEQERELAFAELARNEEQFRTLAQASAAVIFRTNSQGKCVYVNERWEDFTGQPPENALGRGWGDTLNDDDREWVFHSWNAAVADRQTWKAQYRLNRADGGITWVEAQAMPQEHDGVLVGHVGTLLDITDRKRVEEEMRRLNQELAREHTEIEELNRSLEEKVRRRTAQLERANAALRDRNQDLLDARAQAATDGLTGLFNHRAFQEHLRSEVERATRDGDDLGLIMLDIDGFKRVNDSEGHLVGDQILRDLAETLARQATRTHAFRYGGDEFAVLVPSGDRKRALRAAERLRRAVARRINVSEQSVTISLGVASFPDGASTPEELLYGADAAMYWAKSAGKDRVGDWSKLVRSRQDDSQPWYVSDHTIRTPDAVSALVAALTAKDPSTSAHADRCSYYSGRLAQALGLDEKETSTVRLASLLHDVGKIAVPDEVLFKPGPLNEDEWALMKQHPTAALHVLREIRAIHDATPAILHHHEHFDGSGYPDGLSGQDIPLASRILLVTDAYDAMTSDRPYRKAMPIEHAIEELKRNAGTQFDPDVVEAFLGILTPDEHDRSSRAIQPDRSATGG